ncbi:MAG: zinc protease [Flavobacteriales bacterium]|jgi:zinc protease
MKIIAQILGLAVILFLAGCGSSSTLDRSAAPEPAMAPQINLGGYTKNILDNGLTLIVVENHKLPRISYRLTVDRDPVLEGDKAGYVGMSGDLLKSGTAAKSKSEIDETIDFMGARMNTYSTGMSGSCLKKHNADLLALMSEVLLSPSFPEDEIEKLKKQTLSGLVSGETDPGTMSGNIARAISYGSDHPYGEIETKKSIEAITREDIIEYYATYFKPNNSYLVVVGDVTPEQALADANTYFGSWEKSALRHNVYEQPTSPAGNRVTFVPLTGAVQSQIRITYPVDFKPGCDDAVAATVMNSVLGGGVFSGRLMQNLREDKAYTYGARSSLSSDPVIGSFSASGSVRNEVTDSAIVEFMYELKRITEELVPDSTLQFVKNSMNGSFARSLESPQTIARFALNIEKYSLPADYYATYLSRLEAVTAQDVIAAAQKYIKPANAYITVVGNKDEVAEKLARFSSKGEVEYFDAYGNEWVNYSEAPEGVTAQTVMDDYFTALGGLEKMATVKSYKQTGTMSMQGMSLDLVMMMMDNKKSKTEVFMGGAAVMSQTFDGEKGAIAQMGMAQPMSEEEVEDMKVEADFMGETKYVEHGFLLELLGIGQVDDEQAYVVKLTKKSGSIEHHYYSVASGLKIMSESPTTTPEGGEMIAVTKFLEYTEYKGFKYPSSFQQIAGAQTIVIDIDSFELNTKFNNSEFAIQ